MVGGVAFPMAGCELKPEVVHKLVVAARFGLKLLVVAFQAEELLLQRSILLSKEPDSFAKTALISGGPLQLFLRSLQVYLQVLYRSFEGSREVFHSRRLALLISLLFLEVREQAPDHALSSSVDSFVVGRTQSMRELLCEEL